MKFGTDTPHDMPDRAPRKRPLFEKVLIYLLASEFIAYVNTWDFGALDMKNRPPHKVLLLPT